MACEDALLFHATLHLTAFDLQKLKGSTDETKSKLLLNNECIRLLRKRVEDPILGISDQTMGSVLFLAVVEVIQSCPSLNFWLTIWNVKFERGDDERARMHIEGLKRMVNIRGGLAAIRATNPMLANMIFGLVGACRTGTGY